MASIFWECPSCSSSISGRNVLEILDNHFPVSNGNSSGTLDDRHMAAVFCFYGGLAIVDAFLAEVENLAMMRPLGQNAPQVLPMSSSRVYPVTAQRR